MRDSLRHETLNSRAVTIPRHANVYSCGDQDEMVYFIDRPDQTASALARRYRMSAGHPQRGDIFGELCLAGLGARHETAAAMKGAVGCGSGLL